MLRIQITNTPEKPLKKTPTFKRLWHMALQLWYHRQIIKRYKARPIKYKKAYHIMAAALKAYALKYNHLKRISTDTQMADARQIKWITTESEARVQKLKNRISELDHQANYYREFITTVARCTGPEINDLPNGAKAILKGEQDLHPH